MKEKSKQASPEQSRRITKEETEIMRVWRDYKSTKSLEDRDKLILHYAPLVKYVAGRLYLKAPPHVDQADLVSCGIFGLMDAIEKFDLSKNIKFETYAIARIKGAIIDELRTLDWIPRSIRFKAKELERVYANLENKLKRTPTDEEVSQEMGISVKKLHEMLSQVSNTALIALDETLSVGKNKEGRVGLIDIVEDEKGIEPTTMFELTEMKTMLAQAIDTLPVREKTIVTLYYYEGLTLKEIGDILGVTESRVSQMHTKSILQLRAKLRK